MRHDFNRCRRTWLRGRSGWRRGDDRKGEAAALARLALHPDAPAEQLDQPARNRQPESRPAVLSRRRGIDLGKGLKQPILARLGNADAGVRDGEPQLDEIRSHRDAAGERCHVAGIRKLDGVAQQVEEDLPDARDVADDLGRQRRLELVGQLQSFRECLGRQQLKRVFDARLRIERLQIELQLAGLDLREVENVVDDRQQPVAARADHLDPLTLRARQRRIQQQRGHADHAVHRRADLVAHAGEKRALGLCRGLGRFLGGRELAIGGGHLVAQPGDVAAHECEPWQRDRQDDELEDLVRCFDGVGLELQERDDHRRVGQDRGPREHEQLLGAQPEHAEQERDQEHDQQRRARAIREIHHERHRQDRRAQLRQREARIAESED